MERSCKDCFNFVATIPVKEGKLIYNEATARCKEGLMTKGNGEDRIIKNVLKGTLKGLQIYQTAERCSCYDA